MADPEVIDTPAPDPDALTPAEQEYFNSGGEKADGLLAEAEKPAEPVKDKVADVVAKPDGKTGEPERVAADASDDDDDEPEVAPKDGRQRTVSYKKFERTRKKLDEQLAAERTAREASDRKSAELQEKFARGDERLKLLTEAFSPQPAEVKDEDPEPDPDVDFIGHSAWLRRELGRTQQMVAQTRETVAERGQADTLKNEYQADAMSFARETPDFGNAYTHLLNTRAAMLEGQGYAANDIRQILFNEEKQLVERAKATGKRPAAMVYALAQQLGYRKPDPTPPADVVVEPAKNGNGTPPTSGEAKPSVTEEIARIKSGQEASKSLSGAGGAASEISLESLGSMSDDEFEAFYAQNGKKVDAVLGKRH